ncbi:MAG: type II toxin-antitoxin system prevent-host-death family antitoxin [bacterium]
MTKVAKVTDLKVHLSRYLSSVKAGDDVLVTERGTPIARLVPVVARRRSRRAARARTQGIGTTGQRTSAEGVLGDSRPRDAKATVRKAVADERESGW